MIWLGDERGYLPDWITQRWVQATGRRVRLDEHAWLNAPIGGTRAIGRTVFDDLPAFSRVDGPTGLLRSFGGLAGPGFDTEAVDPAVRDFYERTDAYAIDAWGEWCGLFRPFGGLLAATFSRRLQQLNVPLSALDTSRGMTSEVFRVENPADPDAGFAAWIRELVGTGNVIYAGAYSIARVPGYAGACVKVAFPLPNGYALVVMRPEAVSGGGLRLVSSGERFGDPGFYFVVRKQGPDAWARYVRAMRETIDVYPAEDRAARADHILRFCGAVFLRLHYRLRPL